MHLSDETIERHGLADSFVPPHPPRPQTTPSPWRVVRLLRNNLLSAFTREHYANTQVTVRVTPRRLFLTNMPQTVRQTLHAQADNFRAKTPQQVQCLAPLLGDGLFVSDDALWAERRAAVAPIVHGRKIATFAPIMAEAAREWADGWREGAQAAGGTLTLDMLFEMGELTAEIISRTVFGRTLGRRYTHEIIAGFAQYQRHADTLALPSIFNVPDRFAIPQGPRARRARKRVQRAIDHIIDSFDTDPAAEDDAVIASLFRARDSAGRPLGREATRNEAIVIFMAGHETTANTMAWALYCLTQCERARGKLEDELQRVLAGRPPTLADVPQLAYTRYVIEETLRLYPPVPFLGRTAREDGRFMHRRIRKGSLLIVCAWLLHRNREVWSLPDHFVPERFDRTVAQRPDKYAYIPFATGERVCPGRVFALTETVLCLATLWQAFDIRLAPGTTVGTDCKMTLRPTSPLTMTVTPRPSADGGISAGAGAGEGAAAVSRR